jgi:hypothetical protein
MKFNPNDYAPKPQGQLLNTQPQNPDEYFSGPASPVSAWAPMLMQNGSVRLAFAEQVFTGQKFHFRTAIEIPAPQFKIFVDSLVKFQESQTPQNAIKTEVPNVGN